MTNSPLAKPIPRVVEKAERDKAIERHRRTVKAAVFARDHGCCRVCGRKAYEMHELRFRSLLGKRSLENSIAVCDFRGNNCHWLLQRHIISYAFVDQDAGANGVIVFERHGKCWRS